MSEHLEASSGGIQRVKGLECAGPFFCRDRVPATGAGLPAAGSTAAPRGPAWHSDTKCSPKWAAEHAPVTPLPDNGTALLECATGLTRLSITHNQISDVTPLSGLTALTKLNLNHTQISDTSLLVSNAGLDNGDESDLSRNPLSAESLNTHVPALRARGVIVIVTGGPERPRKFSSQDVR